ncbi:MAG: flagellar basal body-associated FliL family protein [Gammaproteobacteria bacterium]|nr:flagellar basal body-associated FliL family protein [Gammaproteobacteria bacterium]
MAKTDERDRRDRDDDEDEDDKKAKKPAKGGGTRIVLIAGGVTLLLVASILGTFLITRLLEGGRPTASAAVGAAPAAAQPVPAPQPKPVEPPKATQELYLALDPPFVVNFQGQTGLRFLQVTIEVMAHNVAAIKDVKKYMPHIRNNLVMLLSSQTFADLGTLAGKEKVRAEALAEIQKIMQEETGSPQISAVYFTSFVMQ